MSFRYFVSDMEYGVEEERAVLGVLKERWLTMGPRTALFEEKFTKLLGGINCALVSSGTGALHLALRVLGTGRGDEVILPSLTFVATANVVIECGARCVFADIEGITIPTLSPDEVRKKISPRTRVIIPVHYAGFSAGMTGILQIVKRERQRRKKAGEKRPLYIVEDAAHAAGAYDSQGRPLGTIGDVGCFSFFSNKNMATGEGGVIVSSNKAFIERIKLLRSHGLTRQTWERYIEEKAETASLYDVNEPGLNYRPTEITAALALAQLKKLRRMNRKRASLFKYAHKYLEKIDAATFPFLIPERWGKPSYHILPILLRDAKTRMRAASALAKAGIQTSHHYRPIHTMSFYRKKYPRAGRGLPLTEEYAARELTLPLHTRLTKPDIDTIMETLIKVLQ